MIVKVYCERCKKYEEIEIEEMEADKSSNSVPKPGSGGLKTYSLVHSDHILNADIDQNGSVRSYKIINRIGDDLERLISAISSKLLKYSSPRKSDYISLILVSQSKMLRNLIISIAQQLMMSIEDDSTAMLQVSKENTIFEFNKIQIYIGQWDKKILNFQSDQTLFAYHLNTDSAGTLMNKIKTGLAEDHSDYYAIVFDTIFIKTDTWKKVLEEIIQPNPQVIISDVGTSVKAITSISTLIEKLIEN